VARPAHKVKQSRARSHDGHETLPPPRRRFAFQGRSGGTPASTMARSSPVVAERGNGLPCNAAPTRPLSRGLGGSSAPAPGTRPRRGQARWTRQQLSLGPPGSSAQPPSAIAASPVAGSAAGAASRVLAPALGVPAAAFPQRPASRQRFFRSSNRCPSSPPRTPTPCPATSTSPAESSRQARATRAPAFAFASGHPNPLTRPPGCTPPMSDPTAPPGFGGRPR